MRVTVGMICGSTYSSPSLGHLAAQHHDGQRFTITKSLAYTFGMTLAVPCAPLRDVLRLRAWQSPRCALSFCAGLMGSCFPHTSDTELRSPAFDDLLHPVAGISMQIFSFKCSPPRHGHPASARPRRSASHHAFVVPRYLWIRTGTG